MNAIEIARILMQHPTADVLIFGDDMSSSAVDSVEYHEADNYFEIKLY